MQLLKTVLVCHLLFGLAYGVDLLMFLLETVLICHNESSFHDATLCCIIAQLLFAQGDCASGVRWTMDEL